MRIFLLFIFSLCSNFISHSQNSLCFIGSSKYSNYPLASSDNTSLIKSFDINNDGNADIIFPSGSQIGYKLGLGNGLFSSISYINTGGQTYNDIEIGDFNNDNKQDIIGHNSSLYYLKNNGNETFSAPYLIPSPDYISEYNFSDFNNDGYKDILCSNYNTICVIKNNAVNTFSTVYTLAVSATGDAVTHTLGDFDWDGNTDIVYHIGGNDAFILNGDGLFNFSSSVLLHQNFGFSSTKLNTFDFNNDGKPDIMFRRGVVNIYKSTGNNNLALMTSIQEAQSEPGYDMRNILFSDINNDGYKEIIFSSSADDILNVYFGDASYLYQTCKIYLTARLPCGMAANDFNNDGFFDVITGTYSNSTDGYNLLFGNTSGLSGYTPMSIKATSAYEIASGDFNNDGYSAY